MPTTDETVDKQDMLLALAYSLLLVANLVALSGFPDGSWAVVPIWLLLAAYSASILKALTTGEQTKKFGHVSLLAFFVFYVSTVVWPQPLHWYDALPALTLFARDTSLSSVLLSVYYLFSASTYATTGDVLQVCGRALLMAVIATDIKRAEDEA